MHPTFLLENFKGKDHLRDLSADERITLKWTLKIVSVWMLNGFS
jgi:hypothetical protein